MLTFFCSLLSSQAADLEPGAREGEGRRALGRVKPTPARPGARGVGKPLMLGCGKRGVLSAPPPQALPLFAAGGGRETGHPCGSAPMGDAQFEVWPRGQGLGAHAWWGPRCPTALSLAFETICSFQGKVLGGPRCSGCSSPWPC